MRASGTEPVETGTSPNESNALASRLRGFGPYGITALLIIFAGNLLFVPLSALLVLMWARASRTPLEELGFARPLSVGRVLAIGIPAGVVLKLFLKAIVMPLLDAPEVNTHFHYLEGNVSALPGILYAVIIGAGFGEETLFRGYLFERLSRLYGNRRAATVLLTSVVFAIAHYPGQGLPGVEQAAVTGLVFGAVFAVTGRLWLPMVMHAAFDVTAVALIYWGWESRVAHWVFP